MIHNIILNLLTPDLNGSPAIPTALNLDLFKECFHSCEQKLLDDIVKYVNLHREIKLFIMKHGSERRSIVEKEDGEQSQGLYLKAMADSLDVILKPFREKLFELEQLFIKKPSCSFIYFYTEVKQFEVILQFLSHFINELKLGKFHGCAILRFLGKFNFSGSPRIMEATQIIQKSVHAVFLRQLSQWVIYGRLVDPYNEFFIVHSGIQKTQGTTTFDNNTMTNQSGLTTAISDATAPDAASAVYANLWHYEILYDALPMMFNPTWAEKVLFIGQTVLMLKANPNKVANKVSISNDSDYGIDIGSLWKNQENIYLNKIQTLYNGHGINSEAHERTINEIKTNVTERLSEIAFNQADLIKHLKLIKDYCLLGRGDLFTEFITQIDTITVTNRVINEQVTRDVSKAFQLALNRTNIDMEQLTVLLSLDDSDNLSIEDQDDDPKIFLQLLNLKFKVKWPLHLFFSPLTLNRYNKIFRFLLQIKVLQNDLHSVWWIHHENKIPRDSPLAQLRTQLMFLIDNLQYYLQVDVVESHFSILMNAVQNSKDFEYIQRAHNVFQANIMSLCFLLTNETNNGSMLNSTSINIKNGDSLNENQVLIILKKIMKIVRIFCQLSLNYTTAITITNEDKQQLQFLDLMFSKHTQELMKLLSDRSAGPLSEPLSQFLLRLDYNYWYSSKRL